MEQRFLLEAEGVRFKGKRVDLRSFEFQFGNERSKSKLKSRRARATAKVTASIQV
jgi:hypothetical protein